uniref:Uncharacterized protein LOC102808879 n=1 Tax=Saccoglossus kowalevskii TaxID=10224 RepID=A0ABM0MIZ6_SACKO|nr:PREDICTED: uncharacterized protein LOC102808879 [Saccoglossus kowalevskii]
MTSSSPSTVLETTKTITQTPAASKSGSSPGSTPSEEKTTAIHITDVATKDALPTLILQPVNPVGKDDKRVWTPVLISVVSGSFGCLALILVVLCVVYIKRKKRFSRLEESNSSKNSTSSEPNRHLPNIFTEQLHPGLTPKAMNSDAEDNSDKVLKSFGVMPDYEEDIFNRQSSMPFIPCADYDDNQAGNAVFYREARAHQNIEHQFTNPIYEPSSYNPHSTSDPRQNNERLDKHDPVYWQQRYSNRPTRNASRGSPNKFEDQLNRLQNVYGHNFDGVSKSPYHLTH